MIILPLYFTGLIVFLLIMAALEKGTQIFCSINTMKDINQMPVVIVEQGSTYQVGVITFLQDSFELHIFVELINT